MLHVHTEVDGRTVLITRIEAGETSGEINLFDPVNASASVTAKEFTQVWRADRADIEAFVAAYPVPGMMLQAGTIQVMSRRIRHMNERLANQESISSVTLHRH